MNQLFTFLTLAMFIANFLVFAFAVGNHFTKPNGVPKMMRLLAASGTVAAVVDGWLIYTTSVGSLKFAAGFLLLTVSYLIFRAAAKATQVRKLSLAFSADEPQFLHRSGIYRYVRHPYYLAYTATWLAAAVTTVHPASFAALALMVTFYFAAARTEENKFRCSSLAVQYEDYRRYTGMFLPKLSFSTKRIPKSSTQSQ